MNIECIYCKEIKDLKKDYKKTEHVIPQAFGKFNNNHTLNGVVCDNCNQLFGNTIDLHIARDTYEGIIRYIFNIKNSKEYKNMGRNSKLKTKLHDGEFKGAYVYLDNIDGVLKVYQVQNQVALYNYETKEFDYFLIEDLYKKSELPDKYKHEGNIKIMLLETNFEYMKKAIAEKGYDQFNKEGEIRRKNTDINSILCEHERIIDMNLSRAVSKIAFNYYTYTLGADYSRLKCFDKIRDFIFKGTGEIRDFISLSNENMLDIEKSNDKNLLAHIITIEWNKNYKEVIATVSLFNTMKYKIVLTRNNTITPKKIDYGSIYSIGDMNIYEIGKKTNPYYNLLNLKVPQK